MNALRKAPQRAQRVRGIPGVGLRTADGREWLRWGPGFIWHRPATVMTPRGWVIARCHHQAGEFIPLAEDDRSYELGCRWDVCEDCPTCTS